jgi:hypothetical protein
MTPSVKNLIVENKTQKTIMHAFSTFVILGKKQQLLQPNQRISHLKGVAEIRIASLRTIKRTNASGIQINEESVKESALTKKHQRVTAMTNARVLVENVAMVIAVMTNTLMKSKTLTA